MKKFYVLLVLILLVMTPLSVWVLYYGNPQWSKYIYIWQLERLPKERQIHFRGEVKAFGYRSPRFLDIEFPQIKWDYEGGREYRHYSLFPEEQDYSGPWKFWSPDGVLVAEVEYLNGHFKSFKGYRKDGGLDCVKNYIVEADGYFHSDTKLKYAKNGNVICKITYLPDDKQSVVEYYDDGTKKYEYTRKNRDLQGYFVAYKPTGDPQKVIWFYGDSGYRRILLDEEEGVNHLDDPVGLFVIDESWNVEGDALVSKTKPALVFDFYHRGVNEGELKSITYHDVDRGVQYDFEDSPRGWTIRVHGELIYHSIPEVSFTIPDNRRIVNHIDKRNEHKETLKPITSMTVPLPVVTEK